MIEDVEMIYDTLVEECDSENIPDITTILETYNSSIELNLNKIENIVK
jgi:hypothetical protein